MDYGLGVFRKIYFLLKKDYGLWISKNLES